MVVWEDLGIVKNQPRPAIYMEKQLGWDHKLGGAESLRISKAGPTVLASLLALWGEVLEKGQWPLLALILDISVSPCIPLVPFNLLPWRWNSEEVSLSR